MNTKHVTEGTRVRSLVNAQGMTRGAVYTVVRVERRHTFVGSFTTLYVTSNESEAPGSAFPVGNPHLVLEEV